MKKTLIILTISILTIPQITFAYWWNPLSWKVFKKTETTKTQLLEKRILELEQKIASTTVSTSTSQIKENVIKPNVQKKEKSVLFPVIKSAKLVEKDVVETQKTEIKKEEKFVLSSGAILDKSGNIVGQKDENETKKQIQAFQDELTNLRAQQSQQAINQQNLLQQVVNNTTPKPVQTQPIVKEAKKELSIYAYYVDSSNGGYKYVPLTDGGTAYVQKTTGTASIHLIVDYKVDGVRPKTFKSWKFSFTPDDMNVYGVAGKNTEVIEIKNGFKTNEIGDVSKNLDYSWTFSPRTPNLYTLFFEVDGITKEFKVDVQMDVPKPSAPQISVAMSSDKISIGANGKDTAVITVKITDEKGLPIKDKSILEISPETKTLTTDSEGTAKFSVKTTQVDNLKAVVSVDGQNHGISIGTITTTASVSADVEITNDAGGAYRIVAPAKDQLFAVLMGWKIPLNVSNLKITSLKIKLDNLNQTWFENFRLTTSEPCTKGRFCSFQTIAPISNYTFSDDGILTITPLFPIDIRDKNTYLYVIADTKDPTARNGGGGALTNFNMIIESNYVSVNGNVNGFDDSIITFTSSGYVNNVRIGGNYCTTSSGTIVNCF